MWPPLETHFSAERDKKHQRPHINTHAAQYPPPITHTPHNAVPCSEGSDTTGRLSAQFVPLEEHTSQPNETRSINAHTLTHPTPESIGAVHNAHQLHARSHPAYCPPPPPHTHTHTHTHKNTPPPPLHTCTSPPHTCTTQCSTSTLQCSAVRAQSKPVSCQHSVPLLGNTLLSRTRQETSTPNRMPSPKHTCHVHRQ